MVPSQREYQGGLLMKTIATAISYAFIAGECALRLRKAALEASSEAAN